MFILKDSENSWPVLPLLIDFWMIICLTRYTCYYVPYKFKWLVDIVLRKPVVSVIPLNGTIMAGKGGLGRPVINMDNTRAADISRIDFSWELYLTRATIFSDPELHFWPDLDP